MNQIKELQSKLLIYFREKISERISLKNELELMERDLRNFEEKKKNTLMSETIYKNNILLYNLKQEKANIQREIKSRESVMDNKDKLNGINIFLNQKLRR